MFGIYSVVMQSAPENKFDVFISMIGSLNQHATKNISVFTLRTFFFLVPLPGYKKEDDKLHQTTTIKVPRIE